MAVLARSEHPTAPRIPNPRSVKFKPLRHTRPIPSVSIHLIKEVSTPPCKMKSSINLPTSLSANAVITPVFMPKHLLKPRTTLYSPPPSQARNDLAVRMRPSPGSRRSITSPSETASYLHSSAGLKFKFIFSSSKLNIFLHTIIQRKIRWGKCFFLGKVCRIWRYFLDRGGRGWAAVVLWVALVLRV